MKKHCCLPPGALDELIARIEAAEERLAELEEVAPRLTALDAAARAFAVVYAIPRIPDQPGETGTDRES